MQRRYLCITPMNIKDLINYGTPICLGSDHKTTSALPAKDFKKATKVQEILEQMINKTISTQEGAKKLMDLTKTKCPPELKFK
jgi:hypothetical protein